MFRNTLIRRRGPVVVQRARKCFAASALACVCSGFSVGTAAQQDPEAPEVGYTEEITVIGARVSDYFTDGNAGILRSNVPIEELSRSVQIFNAEFIEDFQPFDIGDVAVFASNVAFEGPTNGRSFGFSIRGFDAPLLNDGLLNSFGDAGFETYNLDRLEVLKGPDSLQYGRSNAGGMINLVRKLPLRERHAEIGIRASTLPGIRGNIDIGGPLTEGGPARFRLVTTYSEEDSVADYDNAFERAFVAPSIAIDLGERHTVTLWAEYLDETFPIEAPNPIGPDGEILISQEIITAHPDNAGEKDHLKFGLDLTSDFGAWQTNFRFLQNSFESYFKPFVINFPFFADTNTVGRLAAEQIYEGDEFLAAFTANGEFEIAGLRNRITLGGDYTEADTGFGSPGPRGFLTPLNIFEARSFVFEPLPAPSNPSANQIEVTQGGLFVQNHLDLTDRLILSAGVRIDDYEAEDTDQFDAVSPQVGLVYRINDSLSAFANYSESFTPNSVFDRNGDLLDPETGEGFEFGFRWAFSPTINATAAYFDVTKVNVAVPDPVDPFNFSIASGEQTSEGFEIDVISNITQDWSIVASFGYIDTEDVDNNPGEPLLNVPRTTASLFTTHSLAGIGLPNFILGGGLRHLGRRNVVNANPVEIPSETVFDLNLTFQSGPWTAILTVQNITDEEYLQSAFFNSAITNFGEPRNAFLSVLYDF